MDMAKLKVNLKSPGIIDNAAIFLEDPVEKIAYYLNPKGSEQEWEIDNVSLPITGSLDYSLYVVAYTGTQFDCIITNKDTSDTIEFSGVTGRVMKGRANERGSKNFS